MGNAGSTPALPPTTTASAIAESRKRAPVKVVSVRSAAATSPAQPEAMDKARAKAKISWGDANGAIQPAKQRYHDSAKSLEDGAAPLVRKAAASGSGGAEAADVSRTAQQAQPGGSLFLQLQGRSGRVRKKADAGIRPMFLDRLASARQADMGQSKASLDPHAGRKGSPLVATPQEKAKAQSAKLVHEETNQDAPLTPSQPHEAPAPESVQVPTTDVDDVLGLLKPNIKEARTCLDPDLTSKDSRLTDVDDVLELLRPNEPLSEIVDVVSQENNHPTDAGLMADGDNDRVGRCFSPVSDSLFGLDGCDLLPGIPISDDDPVVKGAASLASFNMLPQGPSGDTAHGPDNTAPKVLHSRTSGFEGQGSGGTEPDLPPLTAEALEPQPRSSHGSSHSSFSEDLDLLVGILVPGGDGNTSSDAQSEHGNPRRGAAAETSPEDGSRRPQHVEVDNLYDDEMDLMDGIPMSVRTSDYSDFATDEDSSEDETDLQMSAPGAHAGEKEPKHSFELLSGHGPVAQQPGVNAGRGLEAASEALDLMEGSPMPESASEYDISSGDEDELDGSLDGLLESAEDRTAQPEPCAADTETETCTTRAVPASGIPEAARTSASREANRPSSRPLSDSWPDWDDVVRKAEAVPAKVNEDAPVSAGRMLWVAAKEGLRLLSLQQGPSPPVLLLRPPTAPASEHSCHSSEVSNGAVYAITRAPDSLLGSPPGSESPLPEATIEPEYKDEDSGAAFRLGLAGLMPTAEQQGTLPAASARSLSTNASNELFWVLAGLVDDVAQPLTPPGTPSLAEASLDRALKAIPGILADQPWRQQMPGKV